ncbi:hypothetical protein BZA77DRAFT_137092 [Pyronema omphalodes]|nr:hypothetical protein BZA77DRAFT_137092 [Pyronema omphalodes]
MLLDVGWNSTCLPVSLVVLLLFHTSFVVYVQGLMSADTFFFMPCVLSLLFMLLLMFALLYFCFFLCAFFCVLSFLCVCIAFLLIGFRPVFCISLIYLSTYLLSSCLAIYLLFSYL